MKLKNVHGYDTIEGYVRFRLENYRNRPKDFCSLYEQMFFETDNVMVETSDGYRIKKTTYGAFRDRIERISPTVAQALANVPKGKMVGLYMANSPEWLQLFWAILKCGYNPLLMNTRLPDDTLEGILAEYGVGAVISDGKQFACPTYAAADLCVESDTPLADGPFGTEVIFMSSGTTESVKLCAYTGENFYYQICDSVNIVFGCPDIGRHYEGELKQLTLLPFYHVFGFIAVYLWFAFFSRTFVFPKDLNPTTIQNTVKKHKVTHIFAVPMVWEAVHKAALSRITERGERTLARFQKVSRFVNRTGKPGDFVAKRLLREVREGLFGDSIQFMITGGSHIHPATLEFFNGIGYHLANGYGMTEIGITSVERASSRKLLNLGSIGAPFGYTEYRVSEGGELQVRGKTMASAVLQNGHRTPTDYEHWFSTKDLVRCEGGRYYIQGRMDDLIVGDDGENLNPVLAEAHLKVAGIDRLCIFRDQSGVPTLVASVPGCFARERLQAIYNELVAALQNAKLESSVRKILFTHEALIKGNDIKISRRKLAAWVARGEIRVFDPHEVDRHIEELMSGLDREIAQCFAQVLDRTVESIGTDDNFFRDLGGTSLDYFALLGLIKSRLGVDILGNDSEKLATVRDFRSYIQQK